MNRALQVFAGCLVVAVAGIGFATLLYVSGKGGSAGLEVARAVLYFTFGLVPIAAYAVFIGRQLHTQSALVSDTAVDAVYYLGFLVTLATLLASVVSYAALGKSSTASANFAFIAISFGVSLFATGSALFARVCLILMRDGQTHADPDPQRSLNDRAYELEDACRRVSAVMSEAVTSFGENVEKANSVLGDQLFETIQDTRARLRDATDAASRDLTECRQSMGEANAALFKQMSDVIEEARKSLQDFVRAASLEAPTSALSAAIADVTMAFSKVRKQVNGAFQSFETLESRGTAAVHSVDALDSHLRHASESATAMSDAFVKASAQAAALDAEAVRDSLAQLRESIERLNRATAGAEQRYMTVADEAIGSMTAKTQDLTTATELLSGALVSMGDEVAETAGAMAARMAGRVR
ncbi:MAG: hypothetical protein JO036_11890 [Candidatus Eremiobacteraeota bacterium]|nr:hypothetical protein [Candidatus Eremiobacteraeota bacterium]